MFITAVPCIIWMYLRMIRLFNSRKTICWNVHIWFYDKEAIRKKLNLINGKIKKNHCLDNDWEWMHIDDRHCWYIRIFLSVKWAFKRRRKTFINSCWYRLAKFRWANEIEFICGFLIVDVCIQIIIISTQVSQRSASLAHARTQWQWQFINNVRTSHTLAQFLSMYSCQMN